jgi:hypothetical protein
MRRLRESQEEWERVGIAAIRRRDVAAWRDAIQAQADILREQRRVVAELKNRSRIH